MRPENARLVATIEDFLGRTGMSETTFGHKAVNDGKFMSRIRGGRRCWPETAQRAIDFIAANSFNFTPRRRRASTEVERRP